MNVLIIEDDPMIAEALEDILHIMDHQTRWLSSGKNALQALEEEEFQVILMDLELPEKPGLEVAREIFTRKPDANIIFSTGFSDQVDALEQLHPHNYQLIHKPFDINDIKSAFAKIKA